MGFVRRVGLLFVLAMMSVMLCAQTKKQYLDYIEKYKDLAVEQMFRYKIPASITLAQGLVESGAGTSRLARKGNNHFGIKCGKAWKGSYIKENDDKRKEKFRKYKNAKESYEDHSRFLLQPRYASLFKLKLTDYKGWAKGLKKCGYATSPRYASVLINTIEKYNLQRFDRAKAKRRGYDYGDVDRELDEESGTVHLVYRNNENYYIVAEGGETFDELSEETGVSAKDIRKFNELPKGYEIQKGDILYLERKRKKADKQYKGVPHVVKDGESLYDIAQQYGIRLESLYKMNKLPKNYKIEVGDELRVR